MIVVDVCIMLLALGLALRMLQTPRLAESVVLFIAFGLVLSLAWIRIGATDLALAEAALGAGVTGALFLNALRRLHSKLGRAADDEP
jgi:energy-converting hydrogenase B subunit D